MTNSYLVIFIENKIKAQYFFDHVKQFENISMESEWEQ